MVAAPGAEGWRTRDGDTVVCASVFQDAQSGHCPAHLTLYAPHSLQT
jgi:hypothetical protein